VHACNLFQKAFYFILFFKHGRLRGEATFAKHDARNLTAASARLAELRRKEDAELRMVTPPENLESWTFFDPRRRTFNRNLTHELLGDPRRERSALGGWEQRGKDFLDAGHFESARGVRKTGLQSERRHVPSMPTHVEISFWREREPKLSAVARAVLKVGGCRFPIGGVEADDFHFCNAKRRSNVKSKTACSKEPSDVGRVQTQRA
jgi:hypothetical protein